VEHSLHDRVLGTTILETLCEHVELSECHLLFVSRVILGQRIRYDSHVIRIEQTQVAFESFRFLVRQLDKTLFRFLPVPRHGFLGEWRSGGNQALVHVECLLLVSIANTNLLEALIIAIVQYVAIQELL
jgi:hypothetical protein